MTKYGNAQLRGTVPIYGTVHDGEKDPLRTFEYLRDAKPRKAELDKVFEEREEK